MRKVIVPAAIALALVALAVGFASAAPCGPTTCAPLSVATPGSSVLLVRPQGLHGPLQALDVVTGKTAASFPAGVLSADGRRFVATTAAGTGTRVARFDATTGGDLGSWLLKGPSLEVAAVSANGRFAALVKGVENPLIAIVDLDRRSVLRKRQLAGQWQVDALSLDGKRLYLLEYGPDGGYRVRVDVAGRGLVPGAITDPNEPEPMTGMPWSSIGTRDGRLQLTLFLKTSKNKVEAFIHALSLDRSKAACIDLASGDFSAIGRYALVLSPNGRTLYAANPSLGRVHVVDLARRSVIRTVRFAPISADQRNSTAFGAISRDGRTVYFSAGPGLHAYDTHTRTVRGPYRIGTIMGLGVAPSGKTLLVVRPDGTAFRIDARTGTPLRA